MVKCTALWLAERSYSGHVNIKIDGKPARCALFKGVSRGNAGRLIMGFAFCLDDDRCIVFLGLPPYNHGLIGHVTKVCRTGGLKENTQYLVKMKRGRRQFKITILGSGNYCIIEEL
jgi:hypothetical protein